MKHKERSLLPGGNCSRLRSSFPSASVGRGCRVAGGLATAEGGGTGAGDFAGLGVATTLRPKSAGNGFAPKW
jgi:hypothetical protein